MARPNRNAPAGPPPRVLQQLHAAKAQFEQGDRDGALDAVRRVLRATPNQPEALALLTQLHIARGERDQALFAAEKLTAAEPNAAAAHVTLGRARSAANRHDDALAAYARALELDPSNADARGARGTLLLALGRAQDATDDLAAAAKALPDQPQHALNLGQAQLEAARASDAVDTLRNVRMPQGAQHLTASALAMATNYDHRLTREQVAAAHAMYGRTLEPLIKPLPPDDRPRDPDRRLTIAFLSRDLYRHSCAFFLEPLLQHLDRDAFRVVCFSAGPESDDITRRLQRHADAWHEVRALDNAATARLVRTEGVDVLVECCGHFFGRRLETMALRPAPLSATYLGYPNTTGLSRIDLRIVDADTDPADPAVDALASERLVRLDRPMHCYQPPADAPPPADQPTSDRFTFASFNQIKKITPPLLDAWATILQRAPQSRLLLKARSLEDPRLRDRVAAEFASRGIDAGRLDLRARIDNPAGHLALYHDVHLALDTFPYHGTTTTLEAAWMGVPTLTRAGDRHASRVGVSLNRAMGLDALTADSFDAYVETAVRLATEPDELRARRAGLRDRLASSPLCDGPGFAVAFASAIRERWRRLCAGDA